MDLSSGTPIVNTTILRTDPFDFMVFGDVAGGADYPLDVTSNVSNCEGRVPNPADLHVRTEDAVCLVIGLSVELFCQGPRMRRRSSG